MNARGLDIRLRLPDWLTGLDQMVRAAVGGRVTRGNVTIGLRLQRLETATEDRLDTEALSRVLGHLATVAAEADRAGVALSAPSSAEVLGFRGLLNADVGEDDPERVTTLVRAELPQLIDSFDAMRAGEGAALQEVLRGQLDTIATLTDQAEQLALARKDQWNARLKENIDKALAQTDAADPDRLAHEIALIVVKTDVTEEIDRLRAHIAAARDLLSSDAAIGRKLDFLSQEFNREANTLCSKAQATELTRVGLDLKATIDQMREQVQNVE